MIFAHRLKSLNHSLVSFVQTANSIRTEVNGSLYEWVTESLVHTINHRFIQK